MDVRIIICLYFALSIHAKKLLHNFMHDHEIESIFRRKRENMHELDYVVATLSHKFKRSTPTIDLKVSNKNYTLYLEENTLLIGDKTPVYSAVCDESNIWYSKVNHKFPNVKLYHEKKKRAALLIHQDNDKVSKIDGLFGHNFAIRSLPERIQRKVSKESLFTPHVIYENQDNYITQRSNEIYHQQNFPSYSLKNLENFFSQFQDQFHSNYVEPPQKFIKNPKSKENYQPKVSIPQFVSISNKVTVESSQKFIKNPKAKENYQPKVSKPQFVSTSNEVTVEPSQKFIKNPKAKENHQPKVSKPKFVSTSNEVTVEPSQKFIKNPKAKENYQPKVSKPQFVSTSNEVTVDNHKDKKSPKSKDVVYIEILVVVDYETFKNHGKNLDSLIKYLAAFWNAVDLRFSEINDPKIRLNIAGIVVPKNPDCAPYIENHVKRNTHIDVSKSLKDISKYFGNNPFKPAINYDMVVGMTSRTMYDQTRISNNGDGTVGLALVGTICGGTFGAGAAVITDKEVFSGILTAAHEIGHVLGVEHDNNVTYGRSCMKDDIHFLMNSVNPGFHWSSCSVEAIKTGVSNRLRSKCLTNIPDVGKSTKKVLPGTMVSRDDQCKRLLGFEAYSGGNVSMSQSCVKLTCIEFLTNGAIRYHTPSEPPAEGTVCGQGKICLDGECVQNPDPLQKKIPMPKLMTRNEHCKKFTGFEACTNGPREKSRDCKNLVCYDKVSNLIITSPEPPFEGSDCGFGEVCQNSICDVNPEILKGRVSPPKIKSREEQCQKLGASYHSYEDSSDCSELVCKIMGELEITTTKIHPEDGTDCGEGRICFAYKCISYSEKFGLRKSRV